MKKMVALVLAIAMMMSLASMASAQEFTIKVSCTSTTSYSDAPSKVFKQSYTGTGKIYVYSYDNVDTDEYTNHFRGQLVVGNTRTTKGSKWCTQYLLVPIENSNIVANNYYSISGRGNTNYNNYDGVSSIQLAGYYDPNKAND